MTDNPMQSSSRMGNDLALGVLDQIPTPIMAVDKDYSVIFMNDAACTMLDRPFSELEGCACHSLFNSIHCQTPECLMMQALDQGTTGTARNEIDINGRVVPVEYTAAPLVNQQGDVVGGLEYILDITDRITHERKLVEQSRTIQEISTPAIKLWDRIMVLPIVGVVDSLRAQQMMNTMLERITQMSAKVMIMDIQGVAAVDTAVANHLIKITKATKLMGCHCIISGISSAVAQTLVHLGIDLGDVSTNSTLEDALGDAFHLLNLEVIKNG